jgi:DNA replication protein DnaC
LWLVTSRTREGPSNPERSDLLELLEDRHELRSTILTSQLPPTDWHAYLGDPTLADAICDRLLHHAHRLVLRGPSRRKETTTTTEST